MDFQFFFCITSVLTKMWTSSSGLQDRGVNLPLFEGLSQPSHLKRLLVQDDSHFLCEVPLLLRQRAGTRLGSRKIPPIRGVVKPVNIR